MAAIRFWFLMYDGADLAYRAFAALFFWSLGATLRVVTLLRLPQPVAVWISARSYRVGRFILTQISTLRWRLQRQTICALRRRFGDPRSRSNLPAAVLLERNEP